MYVCEERYVSPAVFHSLSLVGNVKQGYEVGGAKLAHMLYLVMYGFLRK